MSSRVATAAVTIAKTWRWRGQLCNLRKGPNLTSIDPDTNLIERLFHPRKDVWVDHFRIDGPLILGLTAVGRTTVWRLEFNGDERVPLRAILAELGEWP